MKNNLRRLPTGNLGSITAFSTGAGQRKFIARLHGTLA